MTIQTETAYTWRILWGTVIMPFRFILLLFGKSTWKEVFSPFYALWEFIFEPKATFTLVIVNLVIFIVSAVLGSSFVDQFVNRPGDIFAMKFYTLITAGFFHANIVHLLGNILALIVFGRVVERKFGSAKTLLIYFGALFLSSLFSSLIDFSIGNTAGGLGASGAIMGLVAAAILIDPFYFTWVFLIPFPVVIVGWVMIMGDIIGILNPTASGIGHFAHLGGFLSIGLLVFLFNQAEKEKMRKGLIINIVTVIVAIGLWIYLK